MLSAKSHPACKRAYQALFNRLPLVETVMTALDYNARRRDQRQLRMYRDLNRCADIQSACSCLALALVDIFDWRHVSVFRVDSSRESIARIASALARCWRAGC